MERFGIDRVYGMHNMPGVPAGAFAIRPGPLCASTDEFTITITGKGGHAAMPHRCVDPVVIGAQLVGALQSIASRNTDPLGSIVVSVTQFHAGTAYNVIPETAELCGTVRTLTDETRKMAEERLAAVAHAVCEAHGAEAHVNWKRGYPVTVNHET